MTNIIEEECGSDSSENYENNIFYDRLNDNFNDQYPEINLNDFSVTSQDHYVTFEDLYVLSLDNDDT